MYKVYDGNTYYTFKSYKLLLNWVAKYNRFCGTDFSNSFLDNTGVNESDVRYAGYWTPSGKVVEYIPRYNRILDEDDNNLFSKAFIRDVKNWGYSEELMRQWRDELWAESKKSRRYYIRHFDIPDKAYPEFRRGPWPFIHTRYRYGGTYRSIRTTNEKRQSVDKEVQKFIRGSRGVHLPDSWDDICRDWRNDGWKKQGKNKHQWEHGVKTREKHKFGKGVYVCKRTDSFEDVEVTEDIDTVE